VLQRPLCQSAVHHQPDHPAGPTRVSGAKCSRVRSSLAPRTDPVSCQRRPLLRRPHASKLLYYSITANSSYPQAGLQCIPLGLGDINYSLSNQCMCFAEKFLWVNCCLFTLFSVGIFLPCSVFNIKSYTNYNKFKTSTNVLWIRN